jgi:SAM-dependent methyltransferase
LETVESPTELLYEVSRILTPGGRVIVVAPNRRGLWARMDNTPFGHGQPFSRSQLRNLMREAMLSPEGWAETLYVPPVGSRFLLRTSLAWEELGRGLALPFAGLHVVEATKQLYKALPARAARRASRVSPVLVPVPASRAAIRPGADAAAVRTAAMR